MIIVVMGLPGTGKSVVAAALARELKASLVRTDIVRRYLFQPVGFQKYKSVGKKFLYDVQRAHVGRNLSREAGEIMDVQKELVYNTFFLLAEELVRAGKNVVLDATFYREPYRTRARVLAKKLGQRVFFVQTVCPDEIVRQRMSKRTARNVANARYETYLSFKETFEPVKGPVLFVDTTHPLRESINFILKRLGWKK